MKLIMIRHGETNLNKNSIVQGRLDFPLNDTGIQQADASADQLKKVIEKIDVFVSSPSMRALQTTKIIAGRYKHRQHIMTDESFYERDFGSYDGRLIKDVFPIIHIPEGYEHDDEIRNRVFKGILKLYQKYPNETVLVGCHSHTIKAFLTEIFPDKFTFSDRLVNGAFFIFEINNDDFKLIFQFN